MPAWGFSRALSSVDGTTLQNTGGQLSILNAGAHDILRGGGVNAVESGGISISAGATTWVPVASGDGATQIAAEATAQRRQALTRKLVKFAVRYTTNPHTTADTWTLRVNGADVGTPLSITALTTGQFTSALQNISIAAGDLVCFKVVGGLTSVATVEEVQVWWTGA